MRLSRFIRNLPTPRAGTLDDKGEGSFVLRVTNKIKEISPCPFLVSPIIPRAFWGALPATHIAFSETVTRIVLHHTVGALRDYDRRGRSTVAQALRNMDRYHLITRGWAGGLGYHFVIGYDGTIFEGRPLNYQGRHARGGYVRNRDYFTIGVALMGTFPNDNVPTQAQLNSLEWLLDFIMTEIPTIDTIERHWGDDSYFNYLGEWANVFTRRP